MFAMKCKMNEHLFEEKLPVFNAKNMYPKNYNFKQIKIIYLYK